MKYTKPLLIALFSGLLLNVTAQEYNPYKSIGKKAKILTAYHGKFVEVFDYDSVQRIGSILFNINIRKIVRLLSAEQTFKKFSDNSSSSRWWGVDPLAYTVKNNSYSPYSFVKDNPIIFIDPKGADWFYYQAKDDKNKTWHYQEGHKATYTNAKGKEVSTKRGFDYLITFKATGTNKEGGTVGTLTVFNQNKAVVTANGFSGSSVYGLNATAKGNYFINLSDRDSKGPTEMNEKRDNPTAFMGIQAIPHRFINESGSGTNDTQGGYDIQGAYGHGRMRLLETDADDNVSSEQVHGYYIHGKLDAHNWTHGCICNKSEDVFNYFWSGEGKDERGYVPVAVQ
jgi:hypothetical protein